MCDKNAKEALNAIGKRDRMTNVKFYGSNALMRGNRMMSREAKETLHIEDASEHNMKQVKVKLKQNIESLDTEIRNAFHKGEAAVSRTKHANGVNPYGSRSAMMSNNTIGNECSRHSRVET